MPETIARRSATRERTLSTDYRPDIDGLRGLAVGAVLAFHAFPEHAPSGFIGVDIFFVISGFLITGIILDALQRDTFSFANFYARRIRRIFPALLLVLAFCLAFGIYALTADELAQLSRHVAGGAAFVSNFVLWNEVQYFDNLAETKPLLHLWSLGIEEQFYLVWPLLLWLAYRAGANILAVALLLAALSFGLNIFATPRSAAAAFYLPQNRLWELLIGAALASVGPNRKASRTAGTKASLERASSTRLATVMGILGLVVLVAGFALISKARAFPGWWALMPAAGTALIIAAGPRSALVRAIFENKIAVGLGLISFPLYLWHWPLLSFARILAGDVPPTAVRLWLLIASVGLAVLTFRLVEVPIRFRWRAPWIAAALAAGVAIAGAAGLAVSHAGGLESRDVAQKFKSFTQASSDWHYPATWTKRETSGIVHYVNGRGPVKTLLLGDSHLEQFSARISRQLDTNGGGALSLTRGGCVPIPNVREDRLPACATLIESFRALASTLPELRTVVLGACWNCYFINHTRSPAPPSNPYRFYFLSGTNRVPFRNGNGKALALSEFRHFLSELASRYKVYLVLDNPQSPQFDPKRLMAGERLSYLFGPRLIDVQAGDVRIPAEQIALNDELKRIGHAAGITVIDQISHLCAAGACPAFDADRLPIYKDGDHLRSSYVLNHAAYIDLVLKSD